MDTHISHTPINNQIFTNNNKLNLKIASINVNSIVSHSKRLELINFSESYNPDIILMSETKLNSRHQINFKNYEIIRTDRPNSTKGGGTAIMIKNSLSYTQIFTPSSLNNKITEFTIIKIKLKNNQNLYIVSIYANNECENAFINEIIKLFAQLNLSSPNNFYIIAGDLNARNTFWRDRSNNYKGRLIKSWHDQYSHQNKLVILPPDSPTYVPAGTFLDLCLVDVRIIINNLTNNKTKTLDFDSDHKALFLDVTIDAETDNAISDRTKHNILYKKTKWKKFMKHLDDISYIDLPDNKNLSHTEIDTAIDQISSNIRSSIEAVVPKYKPQSNTLLYVNSKIKKLRKQKSKLITLLNKYRQENNHNGIYRIKTLVEEVDVKLKSEFKKSCTAYWDTQHKSINYRETENFFPKINRWFRQKGPPKIEPLHIHENEINQFNNSCNINNLSKTNDKFIVNDPQDILNAIGCFYEKINSPRYTNLNTRIKAIVTEKTDKFKEIMQKNKENKNTVTTFTSHNPSTFPMNELDYPYFCNIPSLSILLKQLPNKS